MKEFYKTQTITYNLMSFTGFKSVLLFSYLLESPKTYEELKSLFESHQYLKESISIDTLRVYINSLERIGCKIVRDKKSEGSRYRIVKNPFEIKLSEEHAKSIIKIYKTISKYIEIEDLLYLTNFLNKISKDINNEELRNKLNNLSPLKTINPTILEALIQASRRKDEIIITYNSPTSNIKEIELIAEKLIVSNNKVYLTGTSKNYSNTARFLVSRILNIPKIKLTKTIETQETAKIITCEIYDKEIEILNNEKIILQEEDKITIEIESTNDFTTKQRVLSLGNACKVIAPKEFKDEIIYTLKKLKEEYIAEEI